MPAPHVQGDAIPTICSYLFGKDRFVLATLYRHCPSQALALFSIPSASLEAASGRGLVDLLDFRLRHATIPIGSTTPLAAILWTLRSRQVRTADGSELRLEWWDVSLPQLRHFKFGEPSGKDLATASEALTRAGATCHLAVFAWWRDSPLLALMNFPGICMRLVDGAIRSACENGHIPILQWCRDYCVDEFRVPLPAVDAAARANHGDVVRWCEENGTPLDEILRMDFVDDELQLSHLIRRKEARFSDPLHTLEWACHNHQMRVLQWLRDNEVEMPWTDLIELACGGGNLDVLRWWNKESGNNLATNLSHRCFRAAYRGCHTNVLQFLWDLGVETGPTSANLIDAATKGHTAIFELLYKQGYRPDDGLVKHFLAHIASTYNYTALLQCFKDNGCQMVMTEDMALDACKKGNVAVLEWWKSSGVPFVFNGKWSKDGVIYQSRHSHLLLEWWKNSGFQVEWPSALDLRSILFAPGRDKVDALQWWWEFLPYRAPPDTRVFRMGGAGEVCLVEDWVENSIIFELQDLEWWRKNCLEMPTNGAEQFSLQGRRFMKEAEEVLKLGGG
ncbi:hypothetical protein DFJ73DRAFT_861520 [Zopfochytrium polystomum]|nr:hypothetical protein DFJ73DRAFT_861520 [Zopfochytrium polystomum]